MHLCHLCQVFPQAARDSLSRGSGRRGPGEATVAANPEHSHSHTQTGLLFFEVGGGLFQVKSRNKTVLLYARRDAL